MSEKVGRYAVLLAAPEGLQVAPLAKALAIFKKIPFQDAARLARNSRGFVGEHLSEEEARELVSRLTDFGIGGLVMAQASIRELAQAQTVSRLEVRLDALRLTDKAGAAETIPSSSLVIVAAAGIKVLATDTVKTREGPTTAARAVRAGVLMTTGLPLPIGKKKRKAQQKKTSSEILFYLDLITREPEARYRIDAQNFDYSFLKKRMLHHSFGNFKMLLSDVIKIAPGALHNKGTRVIMKSQPVSIMGYGSFVDFHRESQWLWTLACSPVEGYSNTAQGTAQVRELRERTLASDVEPGLRKRGPIE